MDNDINASDDQNDDDVNAEIATIPDEFGSIVLGSERALEEFAQQWNADGGGQVTELHQDDLAKLFQVAPQYMSRAQSARYVVGPALWKLANKPKPGTTVTYHRMTPSASSGRILTNPRIAAPAAAIPGAGEVALALAALEVALNQIAARIDERLDVIEDKVDEVLRLASAQRLGDVYGHQRLLRRRLAEVSSGAALSDTDFSSIASLGTDSEVGVERLRQHVLQLLSRFGANDPADKRRITFATPLRRAGCARR